MIPPIVYQDGIRIIATGENYRDIRYGISRRTDTADSTLILSQSEARELAAALTWVISEMDAKCGRESFKPREDKRLQAR